MVRGTWNKVLGSLAVVGPLALPVWAGDKTGQVQIYQTRDVLRQAATQQPAPEQSKPATTESKDQSVEAAGNGAEESVGLLQEHLNCGPLGGWLMCNRVKVSGHIEQGFTLNPDSPNDRQNFGRLFDDRSNDYRLNQIMITFERALEPQPCEADWGFKAQFMYGSDARFIHSLGFMDNVVDDTVQPDIVELFYSYHLPVLTDGGVDLMIGQFVTLQGYEVIYAPGNPLYSHSYIFNFGIPFKHTGIMATTHVSEQLDIKTGLVNGINTGSFDDNNDSWSFHGGFVWKSCDEAWTIAGSFHAGPENDGVIDSAFVGDSNDDFRWIENLVITYKCSDNVTLVTDMVVGKDESNGINFFADGENSEWYGIAQYFIWQMNPCVSFVLRAEVFRDDDGFAVNQFADHDDLINAQRGELGALDPRTHSGGDTTYYALTAGLNIKPYENLLIRPEIRWDWADDGQVGNGPFDDSVPGDSSTGHDDQFTLGIDVILFF